MNYKNKYKHDLTCRLCRVEDETLPETLEHIFQCKAYEKELSRDSDFSHLWIHRDDVYKISKTIEIIEKTEDLRQHQTFKRLLHQRVHTF